MDGLLRQYELLSDEEKNALLIYKSRLSYVINNMNIKTESNLKELEDIYVYYKNVLNSPLNIFIKKVFININFETFTKFMESMQRIYDILESIKGKLILEDDVTLYRGVSINKGDSLDKISLGNLISTSMNPNVIKNFHIFGPYTKVVYEMHIKAGTPVMIVPYSIVVNNEGILKIINNDRQNEIILYKDTLDMEFINTKIEDDTTIITVDTNSKTLNSHI